MNNIATIQPQQVSTGFDVKPANMGEAMQLAEMIANSQLAPKNFQGKKEDTLIAMMMGNEVGLNPLQAIQNIAVINGRPCIWGDAMLALVQNHPTFKSIEETFDSTTMTATCTVVRKGSKPNTETFSKDDAIKARLWDERETVTKGNYTNPNQSAWYKYPKRMLAMRARGFSLRNQFADALLGLITREEAQDYTEDTGDTYADSSRTTTTTAAIEAKPELPTWPDDKFQKKIDSGLLELIASGQRTADEIINTLLTKGQLTEEQIQTIRGAENANS